MASDTNDGLIEAVMQALWRARQEIHGNYPDDGPLDNQCEMVRDWVKAEAQAAVAAVRTFDAAGA